MYPEESVKRTKVPEDGNPYLYPSISIPVMQFVMHERKYRAYLKIRAMQNEYSAIVRPE
jgi:hypothetical protein